MILVHWLNELFSHPQKRSRSGWERFPSIAQIETLEDRCLLATFMVMNLNDSGAGSLRAAVANANNTAGADAINFSSAL